MRKVLIANRGEIACRIIRSCQSLGIKTVAVYSDADSEALHVKMADEAYHIGSSKAAVVKESSATAVHPGYGFLSENTEFARTLTANGVMWIGPAPETIDVMGDKDRARALAMAAGVPILPGSRRFEFEDLEGLEEAAAEVGYPLLVKASAGGGGIGMRQVDTAEDIRKVATATQSLAQRCFGDGTIFLERYVQRARHIEVQVFGFGDGRVIHLYERECSIQRRFQKVIEESPAPGIAEHVRHDIAVKGAALAASQNYSGAGTVEFILDDQSNEFFFLEMNTRIQVEHGVTEMVTGTDLVAMQIRHAFGEDLSTITQQSIVHQGCAIECRLYAENPAKMFLPTPGPLNTFDVPCADPSVRLDSGVQSGDAITAYYDPMIAKLICYGETRSEAIKKCRETLSTTTVEGVTCNVDFLINTLGHEAFKAGELFTGFIDAHKDQLLN